MITKDTSIIQVLQEKAKAREIFIKYGMHCISCFGSEFETIETGAKSHEVDLDALLQELNAVE